MTNKQLQELLKTFPEDAEMYFYWYYECDDNYYSSSYYEQIAPHIEIRYCVPPYNPNKWLQQADGRYAPKKTQSTPLKDGKCYLILSSWWDELIRNG